MTIKASFTSSTLRPGLLVSLKTSTKGNVTYNKTELEGEQTGEGALIARWEMERTVVDPVEHAAAQKVRSRARSLIAGVCTTSAFGLLCPDTNEENFARAVGEAHKLIDDFNGKAKLSKLSLYVITGRIAPDDVEAVRAINSEVVDLMDTMQEGLKNLDVKVVRDAASRAKSIGSMLSPEAAIRIQFAVDAARASARALVQASEQGAAEVDLATIRRIAEQRTAFLDIGDAQEVAAPAAPARAVDFAPENRGLVDSAAESGTAMRKARAGRLAPKLELEE